MFQIIEEVFLVGGWWRVGAELWLSLAQPVLKKSHRELRWLLICSSLLAAGLFCAQSADEAGIDMLAIEVLIPDAHRLATAPSALCRCVVGTPLADAPLLLRRNNAEVLLDDPLVEICHLLVLSLGHFLGLDRASPSV